MLRFLKSLQGIQENIFFQKIAPLCTEMTSNSIGFYLGTYVTTVCDMVTVGLTVSEKRPGYTIKLTSKRTRTKRL